VVWLINATAMSAPHTIPTVRRFVLPLTRDLLGHASLRCESALTNTIRVDDIERFGNGACVPQAGQPTPAAV
jgi:hypothetical protein